MASLSIDNTISLTDDAVEILGVRVSALDMEEALTRTDSLIATQRKGYICVTGVHGIMEAQNDAGFQAILNGSFLCVPDGMPTVWVGHLYGHKQMKRVYGPDFMLALCDRSRTKNYKHFLYGGAPGIAEDLRAILVQRYPGLQVVGTYTPPFRPLTAIEIEDLRRQVAAARPDVMWVGLSTPKQERFMAASLGMLDTSVMVGVGAAFDIHTGRIKDAPAWMKQAGLQWLHRLMQEPRRLGRRYLINNPVFVVKIACQFVSDICAGKLRFRR